MKRLLIPSLPLFALLAACSPSNDVVLTNSNNVVLNDAQANYAYTNDGESPTVLTVNGAASNAVENGSIELPPEGNSAQ